MPHTQQLKNFDVFGMGQITLENGATHNVQVLTATKGKECHEKAYVYDYDLANTLVTRYNSHTALVEALEHVEAMSDDAYLLGHPEWVEIIAHVRKAKAQAKGGA